MKFRTVEREMVVRRLFILWALLIFASKTKGDEIETSSNNRTVQDPTEGPIEQLKVAKFDFHHVSDPFTIVSWILIASLAKLGFHLSQRVSSIVPESCLVILLGVVIGLFMKLVGLEEELPFFNSQTFFLFLLPPIVFEAGYFLQDKAFFNNFGTILLYAVIGTLINAFTVGLSLYALSGWTNVKLPLLNSLVFSTLIAAVDPVAVLAVFEEIHINVVLYILVFGESLLNDAVTVVLYRLFEVMARIGIVTYKEVLLGIASFFVVSVGGTAIGVVWGLITAFTTKYTDHVRVIEPIFVFVMSYLAYLCAELFHLSGILSIATCAIVMKPYVERNVSRTSHTTIKYFLKMLSSSSETLIFMLLGVAIVTEDLEWNPLYIFLTLVFVMVFRAVGVVILTWFANRFGRVVKLSAVDQFIMSYGGIRGAVSFSLAMLLHKDFPHRKMIITTTITVVMFTIFIQGITIKPLVRILKVKLQRTEEPNVAKEMNEKLLGHVAAGMEEILGYHGKGYYKELIEHIHVRYLSRWLIRDVNKDLIDTDLLMTVRRLEYKDAISQLDEHGSGTILLPSPSGHHLSCLARSSIEACAITASDIETEKDEEAAPMLRSGGDVVRVPDVVLKDRGDVAGPTGSEESSFAEKSASNFHTLFDHKQPRYLRKFHRNNILDEDEELYRRLGPMEFTQPILLPKHRHHRHHHRHGHKHRGHKRMTVDAPLRKNLSMIVEHDDENRQAPEFPPSSVETESSAVEENDERINFSTDGPPERYPGAEEGSEGEYIPLQSVVVDIEDNSSAKKTD